MLEDACENILLSCMDLKEDETCLVVSDRIFMELGLVFSNIAYDLCKESLLFIMKERSSHAEEPPFAIARAMKDSDVVVMVTDKSLSHTKAREEACRNGARVASMPQITKEILLRFNDADIEQIVKDSDKWSEKLTQTSNVRIETKEGTSISFSIKGRKGISDNGIYFEKGSFGNIPAGEAFIAPVEGSGNGVIVVNGSMASVGLLKEPIRITVEKGIATDIEGGVEARKLIKKLSVFGTDARNLAELGIGTNKAAILTGNALEDEKVGGTVHLALGDNSTFGGRVISPSHLDGIILNPTVYFDEDKVIDNGSWLI